MWIFIFWGFVGGGIAALLNYLIFVVMLPIDRRLRMKLPPAVGILINNLGAVVSLFSIIYMRNHISPFDGMDNDDFRLGIFLVLATLIWGASLFLFVIYPVIKLRKEKNKYFRFL